MNLIERINEIAEFVGGEELEVDGVSAHDDLRLVADIISSLPKARNGDPVWEGCWAVHKSQTTGPVIRVSDGWAWFSMFQRWCCSQLASTHRTRDEAEAAAAKAGEKNQ